MHNIRHYLDVGRNCGETVKSDYSSQASKLERGPSEVNCEEYVSPCCVEKEPTIIAQDNHGVLEIVPSFVIETADILP